MDITTVNHSKNIKDTNLTLIEYCKLLRARYEPNKKILLIQIPQFIFKSFNPEIARRKGYYAFPPAGLQYLYESLKDRGLDIRILDLNLMLLKRVCQDKEFNHMQWLGLLEEYLGTFDPFIIGVSCMYDSGIQPLMQALEFLKRRNRSIVIAGGVIPTYESENFLLRNLCHFVIKGEGEERLNYLFDSLTEQDCNCRHTDGICFIHNGTYIETESGKVDTRFDTDLIDSYSLIDIGDYYRYGSLNPFSRMAGMDETPFATIQFSRGCRGNCTFCSVRDFIGKGVRKRPVEKVLAEMEFLIKDCEVRHFEWLDDDPLFYRRDFEFVLEEIIKRNWNITWSANNGLIATSIDEGLMRLMRDSGCIGFKIGIETGNPEMMRKIKKPARPEAFKNVMRLSAQYPELFVGGNFMVGFPKEKFSQMLDSFRFFLELDLDWGAFTICQAIRGATAFSEFEDYFQAQITSDGERTKNFIPTRESPGAELSTGDDVLKGLDVFRIDPDSIPGEEQIKEIWFTFNLVGNFINNKNLKPGGKVDKFISWVEMAQLAYPVNPYMNLFLALAYVIKADMVKSRDCYDKAVLSHKSGYWQERFDSFGLSEVLRNFPGTKEEVFTAIERLSEHSSISYSQYREV